MTYFSTLSLLEFGNKSKFCLCVHVDVHSTFQLRILRVFAEACQAHTAQRFVETFDPPTSLTSYSDPD
jgi:hypothetical protein